jgi:hypothetical protein
MGWPTWYVQQSREVHLEGQTSGITYKNASAAQLVRRASPLLLKKPWSDAVLQQTPWLECVARTSPRAVGCLPPPQNPASQINEIPKIKLQYKAELLFIGFGEGFLVD